MFTLLYYNRQFFLLDRLQEDIKDEKSLKSLVIWYDYTMLNLPLFLQVNLIIV